MRHLATIAASRLSPELGGKSPSSPECPSLSRWTKPGAVPGPARESRRCMRLRRKCPHLALAILLLVKQGEMSLLPRTDPGTVRSSAPTIVTSSNCVVCLPCTRDVAAQLLVRVAALSAFTSLNLGFRPPEPPLQRDPPRWRGAVPGARPLPWGLAKRCEGWSLQRTCLSSNCSSRSDDYCPTVRMRL